MANDGGDFPFAAGGKIAEQCQREFPAEGGKGIAVEE